MANKWVEHVKEFSRKHNIPYRSALSNPECRKSYHESKSKILPETINELSFFEKLAISNRQQQKQLWDKRNEDIKNVSRFAARESRERKKRVRNIINSQTSDAEVKLRREHEKQRAIENEKRKDEPVYFVKYKKQKGVLF